MENVRWMGMAKSPFETISRVITIAFHESKAFRFKIGLEKPMDNFSA